jgi:hypothetical protein
LDVLREGALTGQSYKRIVDKLSESFTDFNRHQLTTLTRTFFQTANAQAFDAVYQANQDIMEGKIWTNVNDDRVCLLCLPLGENLYKKGESHPPMPRHPNCRCVFRAKTVSYRSLGIDVDELEEVTAPVVTRGYEKNGKWIIPPAGTGTGRRPRAISFYQGGMKEAFPDLPAAQQKAMLGVGRYNLYKAGELSLDQLVDKQTGKLYLLKEIEQGLHLRGLGTGPVIYPGNIDSVLQEFKDNAYFSRTAHKDYYDSTDEFYDFAFGGKNNAQTILKQVINDSDVYMAMDSKLLLREILGKTSDRKFKNSMETGKGTFTIISEKRAKKEKWMFGITADLEDYDAWPKYGFLSDKAGMSHENIVGFGYGDVYIKFDKQKIKNRTTFTIGDSYNGNMKEIKNIAGVEMEMVTQVAPVSKLTDPQLNSLWSVSKYSPDAPIMKRFADAKITSIDDISKLTEYTEAQIYGKLTLEDVVVIEVESKKTMEKIKKALKKIGREDIQIVPAKYDSRLKLLASQDWGKEALQMRASLTPEDIDRLGDYYIQKLPEVDNMVAWKKNMNWTPPEDMIDLLNKAEDETLTIDERRQLQRLYAEKIPLKEKGGLPKLAWEDYRKTQGGWTADVLNKDALERYPE